MMNKTAVAPPAIPAHLTEYHWRPLQHEDVHQIQQMLLANQQTDQMESVPSIESLNQIFDFWGDSLAQNTVVAETADHHIAALGLLHFRLGEERNMVSLSGNVHVAHRRRGLGTFLMTWLEARAQQAFDQLEQEQPRQLVATCADTHQGHIALFEQQGFQPVRYAYRMQYDWQRPLPEKRLPEGITAVLWQAEQDEAMRHAFNEAFQEHWGLGVLNSSQWQQHFTTNHPHFRSDLTYLALHEAEIVGFCVTQINEDRNQQIGLNEVLIEAIGVRHNWRQQGIATALMVQAMMQYKQLGMDTAVLDVDTQNPTGALKLYENLGFTAVKRQVTFGKTL